MPKLILNIFLSSVVLVAICVFMEIDEKGQFVLAAINGIFWGIHSARNNVKGENDNERR